MWVMQGSCQVVPTMQLTCQLLARKRLRCIQVTDAASKMGNAQLSNTLPRLASSMRVRELLLFSDVFVSTVLHLFRCLPAAGQPAWTPSHACAAGTLAG